MTNDTAAALIARSNRLGADPKNTNYAGGNTSAKGTETDPVTGQPVELLWVKGSGGDLGTLKPAGLAVLRLDRMRALVDVYPGLEREDEMVAAFDYCLHGKGGAAPSIDTAMHGLVDAAHVDHLHPDAGIAIATAADGEALTTTIFGDKVVWVPWRRPGFQLGLDIAAIKAANPQADRLHPRRSRHHGMGRHVRGVRGNCLWIIDTAAAYIAEHGKADPFGAVRAGFEALPEAERHARAAALAPTIRGLASTDKPMVGHFTDSDVVLDFLASAQAPALAALGTSCPDHFLRTKVKPLLLDLPADGSPRGRDRPPAGAAPGVPRRLPGVLRRARHRGEPRDPRRRPAHRPRPRRRHVQLRREQADRARRRRVLRQRHQRHARRRVAVHLLPDLGCGEVPHRVLGARRGQAAADAEAEDPPGSHRVRHRRREPASARPSRRGSRRRAPASSSPTSTSRRRRPPPPSSAAPTSRSVSRRTSPTPPGCRPRSTRPLLAFGGIDLVVNNAGLSLSKPLLETTEKDWDLQHDVMAKGSFLVSKAAAHALIAQRMGGDIIYISSKNSVFAGPNNIAYSATKADQAHQVRLLAVELGEHGVRVNGINPDGVVRGSGIFAAGWGANRAATYGVKEEDLGQYYANRTILKREVVPENVADAVYVLTGPELTRTTGLHIPVDSGVAAAFLR